MPTKYLDRFNVGVTHMTWMKTTLPVVVAGAFTAAALGLGAAAANAEPPPPAPAVQGEIPPPNAPPRPAEFWDGEPVVWISAWGGRWGVWKNDMFITLSSNINTGGG